MSVGSGIDFVGPMTSGPSRASGCKPWLPRTRFASNGMTSILYRNPNFFWASRAAIRNLLVKKKFARVIAGLSVDIHGAGKVGRVGVVLPVIVSEPGVRFGERDEVTGARMIEFQVSRFEDAGNAGHRLDRLPNRLLGLFVARVEVRELVIRNGEAGRFAGHQHFAVGAAPHGKQAGITQVSVKVNGSMDRHQTVLGNDDHVGIDVVGRSKNRLNALIHLDDASRILFGVSLKVVVKVWQVGKRDLRSLVPKNNGRWLRRSSGCRAVPHPGPKR